jgi:hypothetical protein
MDRGGMIPALALDRLPLGLEVDAGDLRLLEGVLELLEGRRALEDLGEACGALGRLHGGEALEPGGMTRGVRQQVGMALGARLALRPEDGTVHALVLQQGAPSVPEPVRDHELAVEGLGAGEQRGRAGEHRLRALRGAGLADLVGTDDEADLAGQVEVGLDEAAHVADRKAERHRSHSSPRTSSRW